MTDPTMSPEEVLRVLRLAQDDLDKLAGDFPCPSAQRATAEHSDAIACVRAAFAELAELRKRPALDITESGRGFHIYGDPVICAYGTRVRVYESSSAPGPRVWLNLVCDKEQLHSQPPGEGTAHLNEEQARAVIARLQTWVDEIPTRWSQPKESEGG